VRHLRRKEHSAIETLAAYLWRKHNLDAYSSQLSSPITSDTESVVDTELSWLGENQQNGLTDLNATLSGVLTLAQGLADRHQIDIAVNIPENLPAVAKDNIVIRQILLNLFDVAIHYAGGYAVHSVVFSTQVHEQMVTLLIRTQLEDTSIKQGEHHGYVHPLNDDKQKAKLDMARHIAEASNINLSYLANTPGFEVKLDLHAQAWVPVLVVDDSLDTVQLLRRYVAGTRYRLTSVRQPEEIWELIETLLPQMIVLDVMMPGVDGWEILGRLKQDPHTAHIPVLVCTVLPQEELAHYLGASAFLSKPVNRQTFLTALDGQMERVSG
jgi:CheY-like chemotaxis protein